MKNFKGLFVLSLLSPFMLVGCGQESKPALVYGDYFSELTDIKYADLANKVDDGKTFLLAVRPKSNCACWAHFKQVLEEYKAQTHVSIFTIIASEFDNATNKFSLDVRNDRETFAIFKDGKLYEQNVYSEKNPIFNQPRDFKSYLESKVDLPTMFYISFDTYNEWLAVQDKTFNIYYARNNCPDCEYFDNNLLKAYGEKHLSSAPLFILDCESIGIREYVDGDPDKGLTPESQEDWNKFKEDYKLAEKYTPYGYNTGYVPTILNVKGKSTYVKDNHDFDVLNSYVAYNDTLTLQDDGKIRVTSSFFSESRFDGGLIPYVESKDELVQGVHVKDDEVTLYAGGAYIAWNKPAASRYYEPLLTKFLDYTLK